MEELRKCYILGAGASISNTNGRMPSIDSFFEKARESYLLIEYPERLQSFYSLNKFTKNIYGIDIFKGKAKIDIEQLMTLIQIQIGNNPDGYIKSAEEELLFLIRQVLLDSSINTGESEYERFAKTINDEDSILTFNWDIQLDRALDKHLRKQYKAFKMKFSGDAQSTWDNLTIKPPAVRTNEKNGIYLKLHGSVDWYYCDQEFCRAKSLVFPLENMFEDNYCSVCLERVKNLMIPPVLNKNYHSYPLIKAIWNSASIELEKADELVIWGYSFPPTDFYTQWLLRRVDRHYTRISVITPIWYLGRQRKFGIEQIDQKSEVFF